MAEDKSPLLYLRSLQKKTLSPQQAHVVDMLSCEDAEEVAYLIDLHCPPLTGGSETEDYFWAVWEVMDDIAKSPDVTSEIQGHIVNSLQALIQIAKGDMVVYSGPRRVWADLPLFAQCMETSFINPMEENLDFNPESAQIWYNFSSFAARCMGTTLLGPSSQAIDALRAALEEELDTQDLARAECKVHVACQWIVHGSRILLSWAQENIGLLDVTEDSTHYFSGGPLYQGPPAVCLRRWGFWQTRFEELGHRPDLGEGAQKVALEAAETMGRTERSMARTV